MFTWLLLLVFCFVPSMSSTMSTAVHGRTVLSGGPSSRELGQTTIKCLTSSENSNTNMGVKYALDKKMKSLPDFLFVKHKFQSLGWYSIVNAQWAFNAKRLEVASKWDSSRGFGASLSGNSDDQLTNVRGYLHRRVSSREKLYFASSYNFMSKYFKLSSKLDVGDTSLKCQGLMKNGLLGSLILTGTQRLSPSESLSPSINLNTGKLAYTWKKLLHGGSFVGIFRPGDSVSMRWRDKSVSNNGEWATRAFIPITDIKNTQISISRSWIL